MKIIIDIDEDDYKEIIEEGVALDCYAMGEAIKYGTVLSEYKEQEMGMSIDEAIEYNKNLKMYMEISDKQDTYKFLEENHIALDMAIDTMRKYQKIEQILKDIPYGGDATVRRIQEVVEDGND